MSSHKLFPVQWLKSLDGRSSPQLVRFSDNKDYVVKYRGNRHGTKLLINEYVANRLAELLGLPTPPFMTLNISKAFIEENPPLLEKGFQPGTQFANFYIKTNKFISRHRTPKSHAIRNRHHLAGIVVFDHWISNTDRNITNLLLEKVEGGQYIVHMIDHGICFPNGLRRETEKLRNLPKLERKPRFLHRWCISMMKSLEEIDHYAQKVVQLPNEQIYEIIQSLPRDWDVKEEEKEAMYVYLVKAKEVLPNLVMKFARKYFKTD